MELEGRSLETGESEREEREGERKGEREGKREGKGEREGGSKKGAEHDTEYTQSVGHHPLQEWTWGSVYLGQVSLVHAYYYLQ